MSDDSDQRERDAPQASAPETSARLARRTAQAERWILGGATATILGLCLSLTEARDLGGTITLFGLASALVGLHRFGRSGPHRLTPSDS